MATTARDYIESARTSLKIMAIFIPEGSQHAELASSAFNELTEALRLLDLSITTPVGPAGECKEDVTK